MLCYKCGSHVPEGNKTCPTCGQSLARPSKPPSASAVSLIDDRRKSRTSSRAGNTLGNGDVLGSRYRVINAVGQGAVGAVYRAHDQDIDVDVALKTVAPKLLQTPEERKAFSQKIRLARKLHHANIVRIYDEGHDGEQHFYTMQLLEGLTLRKVIDLRREKKQPFVSQEIEPIFRQLCAALEYAHRTTYHGDLKPENIIILPDLLKLTDFCLIQALPLKPFLAIQKSRGKPFCYIAPEVRVESSHIDGRADVYSMGIILLEMLTGEVFSGVWDKNFKALCERLPRRVDALIRRALSEQAEARFQAVDDFMESLDEALRAGDLESVRPATLQAPPPPPPGDDDADDDADLVSEPEMISGSSVMLLEDDTERGKTRPQRPLAGDDHTPLERPPTIDGEGDEPRPARASPSGPPPLPPEDDDVDTSVDRREKAASSASLAEEVRRATGESSDVYDRRTVAEVDGGPPPGVTGKGGNGAGAIAAPAPPPLPADAIESFDEDAGTRSEPGEPVGIHDELTALSAYPEPPSGGQRGPLPTPMPTVLPPPLTPVLPPLRRPSPARYLGIAAAALFVLGLGGYFVVSYIQELKAQLNQQRVAAFTGSPAAAVLDAGAGVEQAAPDAAQAVVTPPPTPTVDAAPVAVPDDEARKAEDARLAEAQRVAAEAAAAEQSRQADEARRAEEARVAEESKRLVAERRKADEEEASRLMREQTERLAADKRARDEARKQADVDKQRQREEAKRLADEARQRREDEKRAKVEEAKRRAEEDKRARAEAEERRKAEEEQRRAEAAKADETKVAALGPDAAPGECPRGMAKIDAGAFKMGSAANDSMRNFEEKRNESVDVPAFCMDYYEYPNGKKVVPTTGVTWYQAKTQCESKGKRLCTEEEWEKACKGPGNLRFPYGNSWDPTLCNTEDAEGNDRPLDVPKNYPRCRSAYGPINLSGNAAEWTASKFSAGLNDRVHRGGAADRPGWAARCANRGNLSPNEKNVMLGFRCCADPP